MPKTKIFARSLKPNLCFCTHFSSLFLSSSLVRIFVTLNGTPLSLSLFRSLYIFLSLYSQIRFYRDVCSLKAKNVATWHSRKCLIHARVRKFCRQILLDIFNEMIQVNNINTELPMHTYPLTLALTHTTMSTFPHKYFACVYGMLPMHFSSLLFHSIAVHFQSGK